MDSKKKRKRLVIDIEPEWHTYIKIRAATRNMSINDWVKIAIDKWINEEKKYD